MSKFADLLNRPLPSSENVIEESTDVEMYDNKKEFDKPEKVDRNQPTDDDITEEDGDDSLYDQIEDPESDINDIAADDADEFDIEDLSDEELAQLDAELSDDAIDNAVGDEPEKSLSPEEEKYADDMMSVAATSALIKGEMTSEERAALLESAIDVAIAINEGLLTEADINELAMEAGLVTEANKYNKKMLIRLDKQAKMKQLYAIGVNVSAAAANDPDYRALKKLNVMRRIKRKKLEKKYHSEAMKRMKVYYKRLTSSKSASLAALGKKISK